MGLFEFVKKLLNEVKVCVFSGIGFGDYGDIYVCFVLIENCDCICQVVRGIKVMFCVDGVLLLYLKFVEVSMEQKSKQEFYGFCFFLYCIFKLLG